MSATAPRVLILAGHGRYEDPWHDHAAVSHALAELLTGIGYDVEVRGMFLETTAVGLDDVDLLIVNGGLGRPDPGFDGTDEQWLTVHEAVKDYADSGRPILAYHQAINAFKDSPYWADIVGGIWNRGVTYHPPLSQAVFTAVPGSHPIVDGLSEVDVHDERYTLLEPQEGVTIYLTQHEAGADHATGWANTREGRRVVYDALGHDLRSLESPSRRDLLLREIDWLLGERALPRS